MTRIDKAVVLAAGRGTRMRELTADFPKPMIEVRGKPVLQHIVEGLRDAGARRFLIIVGYHAEMVGNFFGNGQRHNVDIDYVTQTVQDGTGRVVNLARSFAGDAPFILSYGDILVSPVNYKRVVDLPNDVEAIITVTRGEDVSKGGAVFVNEQMELVDLREKPNRVNQQVRGITQVSTHFGQAFSNSSQSWSRHARRYDSPMQSAICAFRQKVKR
ncbi:MAG: UTP--glucose-1-phosphate uridylyltransferase [Candidatus Udaeobacter sp.]|nr:MAG: UTP--glucose-1-phosphate uridylyltransferase [Candidatus Udaeobacter sp.]